MSRRTILRVLSLAALLGAGTPVLAHHGTLVAYDRTKAWTREATVTGFHFANPHPQLFFDLKNADGTVEHWGAELLPNPAALIRNGWTRVRSEQALKPGTPVTVTIAPPRAGGMVGLLMKITDMNGMELLKDDGLPPAPDNSLSAAPQPAKP